MTHASPVHALFGTLMAGLIFFSTGCAGTLYSWTVRTTSIPLPPHVATLGQDTIAVLTPLAPPGLRGNEAGLGEHLVQVIRKVAPSWKVLDLRHTMSVINGQGLAGDYVRMRTDAEQSHILDRDILQKIGKALGVRFIFQPRFASYWQEMEDRWSVPALGVRIAQTRESILRVSLQLWDATNGEIVWASVAEASLQSEAFTQEPVFLEDAERVALGSMMADLLNGKTGSTYTPVNQFINQLMEEAIPKSSKDSEPGQEDNVANTPLGK